MSWIIVAVSLGISGYAHASMSEARYLEALTIADQYVKRQKSIANNANALSSAVIKKLLGRYYQVGDSWDVVVVQTMPNQMRMTSDPDHLAEKSGRIAYFRYEVTEVKTGVEPQVVIQVTQRESPGAPIADPQVAKLMLTMNDRIEQSEKAYVMNRRGVFSSTARVAVPAEGPRARVSALELLPLDVPHVQVADGEPAQSVPELPQALRAVAEKSGFRPDLSRSEWFERDDFFGRPVQFLWQHGDPWPAYLKTPYGVAILVSSSSGGRGNS